MKTVIEVITLRWEDGGLIAEIGRVVGDPTGANHFPVIDVSYTHTEVRVWHFANAKQTTVELFDVHPVDLTPTELRALAALFATRPDPLCLLPAEFTLLDLYRLHMAAGNTLLKDTFRRWAMPFLKETGQMNPSRTIGKPAALFKVAA